MQEYKRNRESTVLFVGPVPPPTTGQSFAFQQVYINYPGNKKLINLNYTEGSSIRKSFILLKCVLQAFLVAATNKKVKLAYFSCAVTKSGNLRDIIFLSIFSFFGIKIVNHLHGSGFDHLIKSLSTYQRTLAIKAFNKVDTSIVLMEAMRKEFDLFQKTMNIYVVENFYDPTIDTYEVPETVDVKEKENINIIYFSNLMYSKGAPLLLEAFVKLKKKYPQIELNIAGHILDDEGMSKDKMTNLVNRYLNEHDNIYYHGLVRGREKADFLFKGDIFVLPTFYFREAFPISIIEAMRCGNLIITTRHNYLENVVNENKGELITPKSVSAIYNAIEKYILHKKLLKEKQLYNVEFAKKHYALEAFVQNVFNTFDKTLEKSV